MMWHMSREPIKGIDYLKNIHNYVTNTPKDEQSRGQTNLGMNTATGDVGILTHYQTTNFRLFQTERVCKNNFKFDENGRKLSK